MASAHAEARCSHALAPARAGAGGQAPLPKHVVLPGCKHAVCRLCAEGRFHEGAVLHPPLVAAAAGLAKQRPVGRSARHRRSYALMHAHA